MTRGTMLLAVLFAGFAATTAAQQSPVQIGGDIGVSIATLVGSDTENDEARTSPYFGGTLVFHPSGSVIGFQTGLLYVPKGSTTALDGARYALKISYIEIPLMLRIGLPLQGSRVMPVLVVGGSLGIKSGCKLGGESGSASIEIGCDDSAFQGQLDLKTIDFGVSAGVELEIPVGARLNLVPSARYTRGTSVIGNTSNNADATNSAFQFGVGVRVRL